MAATNNLLTNIAITNEALMVLRNQFVLVPRSGRSIDSMFGRSGYKNGQTVHIRLPVRYQSALQTAVNLNNTAESNVSLTLTQRNIAVDFLSSDLKLKIDEFSDRILKPQMAQLASDIDADGFKLFYQAQSLSTPGVITAGKPAAFTGADISTLRPWLDAGARLSDQATPQDGNLYLAITPGTQAAVIDGTKGLFTPVAEIGEQYKRGIMGTAVGFEWCMTQNMPTFTTGTRSATGATINGAVTAGTAVVLAQGAVATTITQGDQFTVAGVYDINPLTRVALKTLKVFTVQAATAFVAGAVTLSVLPAINTTAPNQTVSIALPNAAAVTFIGAASVTTDINLAWHKNAFMVAFCDLPTDLPGGEAHMAKDTESGISVRFAKQWDVQADVVVYRTDVLYGWKMVRPELACRVQG